MEFIDCVKMIGEAIGEDDIAKLKEEMKGYFRDDFPWTSGADLLSELVSRNKITAGDTRLLEEILYVLARKELIDYLTKFKLQQRLDVFDDHEKTENLMPVTLIFKYTKPDEPLLRRLMNHLSGLLTLPLQHISLKLDASDEDGGSVTIMMKPVYIEILEELLKKDSRQTGLNWFGVTSIQIGTEPNSASEIIESMIPAKMYKEVKMMYEAVKRKLDILEERKLVIQEKLSRFMGSLDGVMQTMQTDSNPHSLALQRLHQSSGMSTTLWKILGQMPHDAQLPESSTPHMMQDELRQASLYSKARFMRLYPERCWEVHDKQ